jgi:hypothetical protein
MVVSRYGSGCIATGRANAFGLTGASNNQWPNGQFSITTVDGPATAPTVLFMGFNPFNWNGVPLPFEIPGASSGSSGPCYVNSPAILTLAAILDNSGGFTFRIPLLLQQSYHGLHLFSQAIAIDPPANAAFVVSSNGTDHQVVAPFSAPPGGRVWASGLPANGTIGPQQTLVVQFFHS